jgi:uncharacterized protein (DUF111 family)
VRVLASGPSPEEYVPLRSGFGAGTRNPAGRANALRLVLAERVPDGGSGDRESLALLACDVDDMTGEQVAGLSDRLRSGGALDVVLTSTIMKKGRPGIRLEVLVEPAEAARLETMLLVHSTTIGVRRTAVSRRALRRERAHVQVSGGTVALKVVQLPGGGERAKPEYDDVSHVAADTGRTVAEVAEDALAAWKQGRQERNAGGCEG